MDKKFTINGDPDKALKKILVNLLESGKISAVFSLRKLENGVVDYALTVDKNNLEKIVPFYPLMPANAGQLLSSFTPLEKPIAAIIKPCEYRAFIEMAKREQGRMEDFLFITYDCGGVYPLLENVNKTIDGKLKEYKQAVNEQNIPAGIREICTGCEHIYPETADIFISFSFSEDDSVPVYVQTDRASEILSETEMTEGKFSPDSLSDIMKKRAKARESIFSSVDTSESGLEGLIDIFGKCIGCHGCNSVCPICYCVLCDFDSFNYDYNRPILEKELIQKGALRLPPDTLFFHLGRLSHMSFSCVGCGMCSDVCPANIPVASVFKRTGEKTAAMFNYEAGRKVDEEIPVMIYKEEEFPELGE